MALESLQAPGLWAKLQNIVSREYAPKKMQKRYIDLDRGQCALAGLRSLQCQGAIYTGGRGRRWYQVTIASVARCLKTLGASGQALGANRMLRAPDFLVIGAQRAGTTWLHRVLQQHPNLWLPPVKELHYFDKLDTKRTILDANERRRVGFRGLITIDPWFFRYWLIRRSDAWYEALFHQAQRKGLLTGEITPAYATVDEDVLRRIKRTNNEIKLVFIMRDPVERAWSAVNNAVKKGA